MAKKPALRLGLIGSGFIGKNHTFGTAVVARVFDLPYEIATGRKMQHDFEIHGTKGALIFSHERFNELHFYSSADTAGRTGFRKIEAGPDQSPHGRFCVAPGHQLGFNDLKAVEIAGYLDAIAGKRSEPFNFRMGLRVQTLVETIQKSWQAARWLDVKMADKLSRRGDASRPACRAQKLRSHEARKRALRIGRGKFS
jgi:hypothetical protein